MEIDEKLNYEQNPIRIICLGAERFIVSAPKTPFIKRNYRIDFELYKTDKRLNDFEGALVFQGLFEKVELKNGRYTDPWYEVKFDRDNLDKRKKELELLLSNGGFVCFLLHCPFVDRDGSENFENTDLAKYSLNYQYLRRSNFKERNVNLNVVRDEFRPFLRNFGASWSFFDNRNDQIDFKIIAKQQQYVVSMMIENNQIFVPVLLPDGPAERVAEFFNLLGDAIISTINKVREDIPKWLDEFKFKQEESLIKEKSDLEVKVAELSYNINSIQQFKKVLIDSSDKLVESVSGLLSNGFKFKVYRKEEFREDIQILDDSGNPLVFLEVKGTNAGVKREFVNQTDTHRERSGFPADFPSILIINSHIKNSRSLSEKDQAVASEQVKHASKMSVLVLRTIDLLELLRKHLNGDISKDEVLNLLAKSKGWLRVSSDKTEVVSGV